MILRNFRRICTKLIFIQKALIKLFGKANQSGCMNNANVERSSPVAFSPFGACK
ncbi:hypothetical protein Hanom_Chr12g01064931 [Helianthus anomalus]